MDINIPDLKGINAIDFCNNNFIINEETTFDFSFSYTFEPFNMLLACSKINEIIRKNENIGFFTRGYQGKDYAAHMGLFKCIGIDVGKDPGEAIGNNRYLPITIINIKDLKYEAYSSSEDIQDVIVNKSEELANILSQGSKSLFGYLAYSIREIMRNVCEHSTADSIWFAAQYWPTKDMVEIALLDEGVGIKQALSFNPHLKIDTDRDALALAIEPGISGKAFKYRGRMRKQGQGRWDNSGYGLYVTSRLCQIGGSFTICSGESALIIKNDRYFFKDTNLSGTAIRLRLNISKIAGLGEDLIEQIVNEGENRAKDNEVQSVLSASKVSRLLRVKP